MLGSIAFQIREMSDFHVLIISLLLIYLIVMHIVFLACQVPCIFRLHCTAIKFGELSGHYTKSLLNLPILKLRIIAPFSVHLAVITNVPINQVVVL